MRKTVFFIIFSLMTAITAWAQQLNVVPQLSAASGTYDDMVSVSAIFPEGCAGGKYWINGGELQAKAYDGPITIDYDCALSVAGTDAEGRIITDVVTSQYSIRRVTAPTLTTVPAEGVRTNSFYVTRLVWSHVTKADADLAPFKTGGARHGENVVWLTGPDGSVISGGDANNLWSDGINAFKAYIYKHYTPEQRGEYVLHIARGVFVLDGKRLDEEVQLHYLVADGSATPVFSPASGEYKGSVTVTIDYPTDGTAFYKFYKLNGAKAKQYTAPLTLTETSTIEAYGMDEDFTTTTPSATASYTILPADPEPEVLDAPVFTRQGNTLSISGPAGAVVKYWANGRMQTAQFYTAPIALTENVKISCVAYNERGISPTVDYTVTNLPVDRQGRGEQVLITPVATESAHVRALSPNGRWAVGYIGSDTSSKGFIWDLEADEFQYASTIFINQLWYVNDDGTAYGWRTRTTEVDESMTDDDLLWGTFRDGIWTEMSLEAFNNTAFPAAPDGYPAVTALSANGEWAILGQQYRYNVKTGAVEYLVSMSERYGNSTRPEILSCIANDGTIFGTYDPSYFSPEKGIGLVRTNDGRWRDVADWLRDTHGITLLDDYVLSSVRGVTGDAHTLLFHVYTRGISSDDAFTRGLLLRIDVPMEHLAPVGTKAEQMSGRQLIKVSWKAPLNAGSNVEQYAVYRRQAADAADKAQQIATVGADTFIYYDENVEPDVAYAYSVKAIYADHSVSEASREAIATCEMGDHLPVRNLAYRPVGLNSLSLSWDAPVTALPKLQYFSEESETLAFGTGNYSAEFGIRIPASDMATFSGQQIRTFQFIPTGPHKGYTLSLYRGKLGIGVSYEEEPFYTQEIDPATLNYGTVNTIELTTPQELFTDADLYVGLTIESSGNDNMLGISYEGFRSGYTDLCRVVGIHEQMVAISKNSSQVTEIVLPLGLGVASETDYNSSIVTNFTITDNGASATTTTATRHRLEQLAEGSHTLAVTANYRDGKASAPVSLNLDITPREEAYVGVEPRAEIHADKSVRLSWDAPRDDDRSFIHWGDLTPSEGWPLARGLQGFMAMSVYPVNMTADYAEDYEITGIYFCPTAKGVDYELAVGDADGNVLGYVEPKDLVIGEVNCISLPEPVAIDPAITYQAVVNIPSVEEGVAALAYDSSGKWHDGYSNLLNYGEGVVTLASFVQITEHPNWLMGLIVKQKNARTLPLEGYNVMIDGTRQNTTALSTTEYVSDALADGTHTAQVEVIYSPERTVAGRTVSFAIGVEGITDILAPETADSRAYDLQGRRVINDRQGRGLYIIGGRKSTHY